MSDENFSFKSCYARSIVQEQKLPPSVEPTPSQEEASTEIIPFRRVMTTRRLSSCMEFRRNSQRPEIPVENIVNQTKIDTLQWQIKEIDKSRNTHRAVLKQMVTFLEKAHISLDHLAKRLNSKNSVKRSKSEHRVNEESLTTWSPQKQVDLHPDEIPPEKLSQEAFRLLRTALSLLNTQEPNLTSLETVETPTNDEFLAQLAKEFPSHSRRSSTFSVSPKLIQPESPEVTKISTALNRKLSLQLSDVRQRTQPRVMATKADSVSSNEDESGFSSLNSNSTFQDVGLPTTTEEVSARTVLLKSMLHPSTSTPTTAIRSKRRTDKFDDRRHSFTDMKLWQTTQPNHHHQQWPSMPEESQSTQTGGSLKVLWV